MLKLKFAQFKDDALLQDWWKSVKDHFTDVQEAHNALEAALGEESENRASDKKALEKSVREEAQARASADAGLTQSIRDKADELYEAVMVEKSDRMSADEENATYLSAEATARRNSDQNLQESIKSLKQTAHTHSNMSLLNGITGADLVAWRNKTNYDLENVAKIAFLTEMLKSCMVEIKNLYGAFGVTLYDAGFLGDDDGEEEIILDGGDFDESTEYTECDMGEFE